MMSTLNEPFRLNTAREPIRQAIRSSVDSAVRLAVLDMRFAVWSGIDFDVRSFVEQTLTAHHSDER